MQTNPCLIQGIYLYFASEFFVNDKDNGGLSANNKSVG